MKPTERTRQLNMKRFDVLSIPGYVIKKESYPRCQISVRRQVYFKAKNMLLKARKGKNGNCKTILERWNKDDNYRNSLSENAFSEEDIQQYDAIALEDHSFNAPEEERSQNEKSWKISVNR